MEHKEAMRKVLDVLILMFLVGLALGLGWICSQQTSLVRPSESDCMEVLQAQTRRTANFTKEDVLQYGRCLLEQEKSNL
jgi:hypothetical protein